MTAVLFVCARNGGKSQMAAGLVRAAAPDIAVDSAGTDPGTKLNAQSVASLAEVGVDISGGAPKPVTADLLAAADVVVTLGSEARIDADLVAAAPGTVFETWETDEPSARGIEGMERMRLVRDDIAARVTDLAGRLPR
ncbi:low molecular weight phosphatase family protein [Klenkia terrae]|uniref:Low molecular weight phosphatase family protein n=1 Tax=Klenkia terrae TaxID=1052259 RepID=A0ABU8E469_9ACTN